VCFRLRICVPAAQKHPVGAALRLRCGRVNRRQKSRSGQGMQSTVPARWRGTSIRRLYGVEKARNRRGHERQEQRARQRHYAAWEQILKATTVRGLDEAQGGENEGHVRGPGNRRRASRSANSSCSSCAMRAVDCCRGLAWYQRRDEMVGRLRGARAQRWRGGT